MKHVKLFETFVHTAFDNAGEKNVTPEEMQKMIEDKGWQFRKDMKYYCVNTGDSDMDDVASALSELGISDDESSLRGDEPNPNAINWVLRRGIVEDDEDGLWVEIQYLGE